MNTRYTQILALTLALFTANIGMARAELLLCQTRCDYLEQDHSEFASCCGHKSTLPSHDMAGVMDHESPQEDCPHLKNSKKISGSLAFVANLAKTLSPDKTPALSGAITVADLDLPSSHAVRRHQRPFGLSPPGNLGPPPYRLNCSLLI